MEVILSKTKKIKMNKIHKSKLKVPHQNLIKKLNNLNFLKIF